MRTQWALVLVALVAGMAVPVQFAVNAVARGGRRPGKRGRHLVLHRNGGAARGSALDARSEADDLR